MTKPTEKQIEAAWTVINSDWDLKTWNPGVSRDVVRRALSAALAVEAGTVGVSTPIGWYLVPEAPTKEQMQAGLYQASHDATYDDVCQSYMAMVRTPIDRVALTTSPASSGVEGEAVAVPDGWRLVPIEPTREMWAAMADTLYRYKNRHHDKVAGDLFKAMLSALPAAPSLSAGAGGEERG